MARYAEIADLTTIGLHADLIDGIATATINAILDKRSRTADGYIAASGRYKLPLVAPYPGDLVTAVCQLAAWDIMSAHVGTHGDEAANTDWEKRAQEATSWLKDLQAGRVAPPDMIDSSADVTETSISISSEPLRGWGCR